MPKLAMVTGANGHVGNNLVRELLARGYRVRATVRNAADPAKSAHLASLGVDDVVSLDVRDAGAFEKAASGVDIMFHVAATYRYYTGSRQADEEMLRDSIEGAAAAINAAHACKVGKVVLTSSIVTLPLVARGRPKVTEEDWQADFRLPYLRAKTLAEKEAWRLAGELGVKLVTVLPGAILGPGFLKRTTSTDVVEGIMLGGMRMGAPNSNFPAVDIRDVIEGHLLAAEKECSGRFAIINDHQPYLVEMTRIMHEIDKAVPESRMVFPDFMVKSAGTFFDWLNFRMYGAPRIISGELLQSFIGREFAISNERAKRELGWRQMIPLEQSLADTMATLRALRAAPAAA